MNTSGKIENTRGAGKAFTSLSAALVLALGLGGAACAVDGQPASVSTFGPGVATAPSASASASASGSPMAKQTADLAPAPVPVYYVNPTGSGETVTVYIQNIAGGRIELIDGSSITIPAGALSSEAETITVTASTEAAPHTYEAVSPMFVIGPASVVFAHPVTVTMPVTVGIDANTTDFAMMWSTPAGGYATRPTSFASDTGTTYIASAQISNLGRGWCVHKPSAATAP